MKIRCMGCMELFDEEYDVCPFCGYVANTPPDEKIHMMPGTLLNDRYVTGKVLGYGGFGITYIGWDGKLEQKVAIKEYLPGEFSTRYPGQTAVSVFNGEKREQFESGLEKFVEEAKKLAKFQNENGIVKIFDSFEENGTAYIIMEYLDGETLKDKLLRDGPVPEDKAVEMLLPVMKSLQVVHSAGLLHRDIAPDNIFITKDGDVKLIDFGASRYATTSHSRSLTVIIKPGYSPEEQYRSRGDQGPHTDVYSIAATLYRMITGQTPPDSIERRAMIETKKKDPLIAPHRYVRTISPVTENAIMNAMNVRIEDRTPDIRTFIQELNAVTPAKRIYGKIKKIDLYSWPLAFKILVPAMFAALLLVAIFLATGVIRFDSLFSNEVIIPDGVVVVPDVEDLGREEAIRELENAKLTVSTDGGVFSDYVDPDKIVLQSLAPGTYINEYGTISLTVSSGTGVTEAQNGTAVVPYLIWDTVDQALVKLSAAGLAQPLIQYEYSDTVTEGQVIRQSVDFDTEVEEGTQITIVVSSGPVTFEIISVVGLSFEEAKATLASKGLIVQQSYVENSNVAENTVISQSISEGSSVKKGDTVTLIISSGVRTVAVPGVVGHTQKEAVSALEQVGLIAAAVENYDSAVAAGNIISQSPVAGTQMKAGETVTLYVSKGQQSATVTLDGNGTEVSPKTISVFYGSAYGKLPDLQRSEYSFLGWYTDKSGGTEVKNTTTVRTTSNHTLYAHWSRNALNVTLDANGHDELNGSLSVITGAQYGSLPELDEPGYNFAGWFTDPEDGTEVKSTTVVTATSDHTLYAHWSPKTFTIQLDPNGGTLNRKTEDHIDYNFGDNQTLPRNLYLTGYSFAGWYTEKTGGDLIKNLKDDKIAADHTLYAHWEPNTYVVTLSPGSPYTTLENTTITVTYDGYYDNLPVIERGGYVFLGWYTEREGGTEVTGKTQVKTTKDHRLYGRWAEITLKVTLDPMGGELSRTPYQISFTLEDENEADLPKPSMTGYNFLGWFTEKIGGEKVQHLNFLIQNRVIDTNAKETEFTIYARWEPRSSKVTLVPGSLNTTLTSNTVSVIYGEKYALPIIERPDYVFLGWFTDPEGGTEVTNSTIVSNTDDHTLYAHWKAQ